MTNDEFQYLTDLECLDRIDLGMLQPSSKVKRPRRVQEHLFLRGWIRLEGLTSDTWGPTVTLRTRGLRALNRARDARQQEQK